MASWQEYTDDTWVPVGQPVALRSLRGSNKYLQEVVKPPTGRVTNKQNPVKTHYGGGVKSSSLGTHCRSARFVAPRCPSEAGSAPSSCPGSCRYLFFTRCMEPCPPGRQAGPPPGRCPTTFSPATVWGPLLGSACCCVVCVLHCTFCQA